MKRASEIAGLCCVLLCLLGLLWMTFYFEPVEYGAGIGPASWPRAIIGLAIFSLAFQIYLTLRRKGQAAVANNKSRHLNSKVVIRLCILLGYLISLPYLGFFWSSPFFLFIAMSYLGRHGIAKNIGISLGTTIVLLIIYISILYVPLPKGVWIFETGTNLLLRLFLH